MRNRVAVDGFNELQQLFVTGSGLIAPVVEQVATLDEGRLFRGAGFTLRSSPAARGWVFDTPGDGDLSPHTGDRGEEVEMAADALGFFLELVLGSVGIFLDDVGIEAIVGAIAIDDILIGGAVELVGLIVVPGFVVVIVLIVSIERIKEFDRIFQLGDQLLIIFLFIGGVLSGELKFGHLPIGFGTGFEVRKELSDERPLIDAGRDVLFLDGTKPAQGKCVE